MLPIGDICSLKNVISGFLKLLRDMVNFEVFRIGENNFKPLQRWTFDCLSFKVLLDEKKIKIHCILLV